MRRARQVDPLMPIDLLVGSNLLGLYLRRLLARRLGAVAAVNPVTFLDLAERRAGPGLLAKGRRPLPPLGGEWLMARIARDLRSGSLFESVRSSPGFRRALLGSIQDLKDAGWSPSNLRDSVRRAHLAGGSRPKLDLLTAMYESYEGSLRDAGFYDRSDLLAQACEAEQPGAAGERSWLLVYGFYDLIELQWRLFLGESLGRETRVFVPWQEGPAFQFARPFMSRLRQEGFEIASAEEEGLPREDSHARGEWLDRLFLEEALSLASETTRSGVDLERAPAGFLSAPGEEREADEVVRLVLEWASQGIKFAEIGLLSRSPDRYRAALDHALERAGVPHYVAGGKALSRTRSALTALALVSIPLNDWSRDDVIGFLSIADLEPTVAGGSGAVPSDWDLVSAEAGIAGGLEQWRKSLTRVIARASFAVGAVGAVGAAGPVGVTERDSGKPRGENEDDGALGDRAEGWRRFEGARSLAAAIEAVASALDCWPREGAWSDCATGFVEALRRLLRESSERTEVERALMGLGKLDLLGSCPGREAFAEFAVRALDGATLQAGRFERDGVFLGDAPAARGLSFRAVALAGTNEKLFPVHGEQDPFLLDDERRALFEASRALAPLPQKGDRLAEERLLFRLAAGSARERLLVSWSRLARDGRSEAFPSVFARQAAGALAAAADHASPQSQPAPCLRFVPISPLFDPGPDRALDAGERRCAVAGRLGGGHGGGDLRALGGELPFLTRGLASERSRWEERTFGPYDGWLGTDAAERAYARFLPGVIPPTRIEEYATCPLRAFFERVLGARPVIDPERIESIEPRERGTLVHRILARFLGTLARADGAPASLDRSETTVLRARLHEAAEAQFRDAEQKGAVGYPLLWEIEQGRILLDLDRWLDFEIERNQQDRFTPAALEWRFGDHRREESGAGTALAVNVPGVGEVLFSGRIDRVDRLGEGPRARVVDYKSGQSRDGLEDRIRDGRGIQLPIYMLAAAGCTPPGQPPLAVESGEYLYLSGSPRDVPLTREVLSHLEPDFTDALGVLLSAARDGDFTADPRDEQVCKSCLYRAPCGEGRSALFRRKREDPRALARIGLRIRGSSS